MDTAEIVKTLRKQAASFTQAANALEGTTATTTTTTTKRRRRMSNEARRRISEAQKRRWALQRGKLIGMRRRAA